MTGPDPGGHWQESASSWRTAPRPIGWKKNYRAPVLERDGYTCTWIEDGERCTEEGTDVDHIGDPTDHRLENMRALCGYHHRKRTALQARLARGPMPSRQRPAAEHPGLIATARSSAAEQRPPWRTPRPETGRDAPRPEGRGGDEDQDDVPPF